MKKVIAAVLAALICAATGSVILWKFNTMGGLIGGGLFILLAVAIALPTQLQSGTVGLKSMLVMIVPTVVGAIRGGARATDPPADPKEPTDVV